MAEDVSWIYWTIFVVYMIFLLVSGWRARNKTKNLSDFLVAGRNIGPILMGLSLGVTYFSASLLVGSGTYAFRYGLGSVWIGSINAIVGIGLFMIIFGNRTRALSAETGCLTVPEMLGKRYQSTGLQLFTALITFVFEILYLVAVYMGLSVLFSVIMPGISNAYTIAVILCGVITISYLVIGGSHGAIATDLVESLIMLVGVLVLFFFGLSKIGGFVELNNILEPLKPNSGYTVFPGIGGFALIGMILVSSFGIWGSPQMVSRYFTAKNKKSVKGGLLISLIWGSLIAVLAYLNACIAMAYNKVDPLTGLTGKMENLIPLYMVDVLNPWLGALFVACVTAASLTTEEKIILVSTSAISRDFYQKISGASDEKTMKVTKAMTVVVVIAAVWLAMSNVPEILVVTFFAFSSMASAILVPYFYGIYWKKGTKAAAIITAIVCATINIGWWFCISLTSANLVPGVFPLLPDIANSNAFNFAGNPVRWGDVNEFIPTQIVGFILFPIISKFTKPPEKEFVDKIFTAMAPKKEK